MAKPTPEQVQKLEMEHKAQFVNLVLANRLFLRLLPRIHGKSKTSKEYIAVTNLGKKIAQLAGKWYERQIKLEQKAKIPPVPKDLFKYFMVPKAEKLLTEQAKAYLKPNTTENAILGVAGIGIIPLIIWAVILIVAAFSAVEITDQLNTTAEEKADLMKQTEQTLKDLNVTGPQAAAVIAQTQEQASQPSSSGGGLITTVTGGGVGGFMNLALIGAFAYMILGNKSSSGGGSGTKKRKLKLKKS